MDSQRLHPANKIGVLASFAGVSPHIYNAFDAATGRVREFFESQPSDPERQRDPFVAAHLTRFWAGNYLAAWGLEASMDPIWLPNNGVALRYQDLDIRCLKASFGSIPGPGPSRVKRRFYSQAIQDHLFLLEPEKLRQPAHVNLVVTWDVDRFGKLVRLDLHSPAYAGATRDSVGLYWSEELIHPAESYEPEPEPESSEEMEDLPGYDEERPDEGTGLGAG